MGMKMNSLTNDNDFTLPSVHRRCLCVPHRNRHQVSRCPQYVLIFDKQRILCLWCVINDKKIICLSSSYGINFLAHSLRDLTAKTIEHRLASERYFRTKFIFTLKIISKCRTEDDDDAESLTRNDNLTNLSS